MTIRGDVLDIAKELTEGDRNKSYRHPHPNLTCFAQLVEVYVTARKKASRGQPLNSVDGAVINVLSKVSRVAVNQYHEDNYVDMAAYAAIAGECAHIEADPTPRLDDATPSVSS